MNGKKWTLLLCLPLSISVSAGDWRYNQNRDEMRDTTSYYANLDSTNSIDLLSPYNGGSKLTIAVYSADDNLIKSAGLLLSKGMINCNKGEPCKVNVKFDNGKIQELHTSLLADDYDVLGISSPKSFVQSMKMAKNLIIEVPLYKNGEKQFKFDLSGLQWEVEKDKKLFKSSFGIINLNKILTLPSNATTNDFGYTCFDIQKFKISEEFDTQGDANICTYNNYVSHIKVKYPYSDKVFNKLVRLINNKSSVKEESTKEFAMWLPDDFDGLSSIMMLNNKKDGLELLFDYKPTGALVPPQ